MILIRLRRRHAATSQNPHLNTLWAPSTNLVTTKIQASFETSYKEAIALASGTAAEDTTITSYAEGSVVVSSDTTFPFEAAVRAEGFASMLAARASIIFSTLEQVKTSCIHLHRHLGSSIRSLAKSLVDMINPFRKGLSRIRYRYASRASAAPDGCIIRWDSII